MISLGTWPYRQPGFLKEAPRFVGMRAYGVEAAVGVRNGRIMETEFGVSTEATPGSIGGNGLLRWPRFPTVSLIASVNRLAFVPASGQAGHSSIATYRVH